MIYASLPALHKQGSNEDGVLVLWRGDAFVLLAVADGMGGGPNGEDAARVTLQALVRAVEVQGCAVDVLSALDGANAQVQREYPGAGCTVAVAVIENDNQVRTYHVGDAAIFWVGGRGKSKYRSTDHGPVGYALASGFLDEHDAMFHPERHFVTNYVGSETMSIDVGPPIQMLARDTLLVCSDGVTDNLFSDEILNTVSVRPLGDAILDLLALVAMRTREEHGPPIPHHPDDVSVILYRFS